MSTAEPSAPRQRTCLVLGAAAIALVLVAAIAGLFGLRSWVRARIVKDPVRLEAILHELVDAGLPPGYRTDEGFGAPSALSVALVPVAGRGPRIIVVRAAAGMSPETVVTMMEGNWKTGGQRAGFEAKEPHAVTLRGAPLELRVFDDRKHDVRHAFTAFPGKAGTVTLAVEGPLDGWDWTPVDVFVASIR